MGEPDHLQNAYAHILYEARDAKFVNRIYFDVSN